MNNVAEDRRTDGELEQIYPMVGSATSRVWIDLPRVHSAKIKGQPTCFIISNLIFNPESYRLFGDK